MKKKLVATLLTAAMVCSMGAVSAVSVAAEEADTLTIGFSQVGAESDWRTANTESMKTTFSEENGYELIFDDAQQKQENQVTAIRNFIQQEVDYILLAPVTETGWDTVLQEAKDAGIPVIIVDRMVDVSDDSLFTTWIGTDSLLEGRKAAEWLNAFATAKEIAPEDLHIVDIQGTIGSTAQIGRTQGLEEGVEKYGWDLLAQQSTAKEIAPEDLHIVDIQGTIGSTAQIGRTQGLEEGVEKYGWDLLAQQSGEFTQAKGQEVMESMLKQYDNINVVYCENDNEAFGAIDAIEAAGKKVGSDIANGEILVISFDTTNAGLTDTLNGKIACDVECNPLHGPRAEELIKALEAGEEVEKLNYVDEEIFAVDDTVKEITAVNSLEEEGTYAVTPITQEIIDGRAY